MSNQQPYGPPGPQHPAAPQYGSPPPPQYGGPQYGAPQYGAPPQYGQVPQYAPQYGPAGPGFGWGPQFGQQPPKKKGKGWIAIPIVVGLVVVAGLWVIGVVNKQNRMNDYAQPVPIATYPPAGDPTAGQPTSRPTAARPTATRPTATRPTAPRPTKTTPPPRQPTPYEVATRDRIYRSGVQASVGCREPKARAANIAGARAYYLQVKACLDRAWPRQLRAAGDPFRPPRLIAMTGPAQSPCGGGAPSSFYCSANETIYMDAVGDIQAYARYRQAYQRTFLRADMVDTVAHEYGHHVQWLSGTLRAYRELAYEAPNRALALELARRKEIQATCFGAVFIGANRRTYPMSGDLLRQWNWLTAHSGDEYGTQRDHGSREIQPYWVNRGFNSRNPALCNTFTATSDKVR